jgi:Ni,Fe-hydrogenase III large subunit
MTGFLASRLEGLAPVPGHRPWQRWEIDEELWSLLGRDLEGGAFDLMGLWGERQRVHMALLEHGAADQPADLAVVTLATWNGRFPSIGALHRPAIRLERAIWDLVGLEPEGLPDQRLWLDHGTWALHRPLAAEPEPAMEVPAYVFLPSEGEGLHQIPVGPIHAGIIEPGHFRFTAQGETVVRLEERLGYVHKGIEKLLEGADLVKAARLVARVSGDATVAWQIAFARAVEAATDTVPPERADWLRALLGEIERIANHLGDIGAVCNDAAFALVHSHCGILREQVLGLAGELFGHRLMMDLVVPGGTRVDLDGEGRRRLALLVDELEKRLKRIVEVYDGTPSLMDRTSATGIVAPDLVRRFAAGGHVGRASGRSFDSRRNLPWLPYDRLAFEVPVFEAGDVDARVWVRIRELEESFGLVRQILKAMPEGPVLVDVPPVAGEGLAFAESFRGEVMVWLRLQEGGIVERCHPRDPSWFQWPLLEAAIEGNIVADFPLCNKSFNCSYSGHDL